MNSKQESFAMSDGHRQYEYRHDREMTATGMFGGAVVVFGGILLAIVWGLFHSGPVERFTDWLMVAAMIFSGVWVFRESIRDAIHHSNRPMRIVLDETCIRLPRSPHSWTEITVPYDSITRIRSGWLLGRRVIYGRYGSGKFRIFGSMLPDKKDIDEILEILLEKAPPTAQDGVRWPRQFTILSMLIVTTIVAILLGIRLWINPNLYWGELWFLIYVGVSTGLMVWLISFAPTWARVFAIGFILGGATEWTAMAYVVANDLVQFVPGTLYRQGSYPLTLLFHRILESRGWVGMISLWPMFLACTISGIIGGTVICSISYGVRFLIGRQRNRPRSGHEEEAIR